jgi:hypothetical protein
VVRLPEGARYFSLSHSVQAMSGAQLISRAMRAGVSFSGGKRPRREAYHSLPSSVEVKNGGAIPTLPSTSSWPGA